MRRADQPTDSPSPKTAKQNVMHSHDYSSGLLRSSWLLQLEGCLQASFFLAATSRQDPGQYAVEHSRQRAAVGGYGSDSMARSFNTSRLEF